MHRLKLLPRQHANQHLPTGLSFAQQLLIQSIQPSNELSQLPLPWQQPQPLLPASSLLPASAELVSQPFQLLPEFLLAFAAQRP